MAAAVSLDIADWWEPTADNYLRQVPKSPALDAVREAVSAEAAAALAKQKKDELVARAEAQLAGRRWLPGVLRSHSRVAGRAPASLHLVTLTPA